MIWTHGHFGYVYMMQVGTRGEGPQEEQGKIERGEKWRFVIKHVCRRELEGREQQWWKGREILNKLQCFKANNGEREWINGQEERTEFQENWQVEMKEWYSTEKSWDEEFSTF